MPKAVWRKAMKTYNGKPLPRRCARWGRRYDFSECTTAYKVHRFFVMELGDYLSRKYQEQILIGNTMHYRLESRDVIPKTVYEKIAMLTVEKLRGGI